MKELLLATGGNPAIGAGWEGGMLSVLAYRAASSAEWLGDELARTWAAFENCTAGDARGCFSTMTRCLGHFANVTAEPIFELIESFKDHEPTAPIAQCGAKIRTALERVAEVYRRVARYLGLGSGTGGWNRYARLMMELTVPDSLARRRVPAFFRGIYARHEFRVAVLDCIANRLRGMIQAFQRMLRAFFRRPAQLRAESPMLGAYARKFVQVADREMGVVLIRAAEGRHLLFNIPREAEAAWQIIARLFETRDPNGFVKLPPVYINAFVKQDRDRNVIKTNDLFRFAQHIHSAGRGSGLHYFAPTPRDIHPWNQ